MRRDPCRLAPRLRTQTCEHLIRLPLTAYRHYVIAYGTSEVESSSCGPLTIDLSERNGNRRGTPRSPYGETAGKHDVPARRAAGRSPAKSSCCGFPGRGNQLRVIQFSRGANEEPLRRGKKAFARSPCGAANSSRQPPPIPRPYDKSARFRGPTRTGAPNSDTRFQKTG